MKKCLFAVLLAITSVAASANADVEARYKKSCYACHGFGANGAPKTGDVAAWTPRLEKGMETLVKHAREGFNTMSPMGLCFDCSDADFQALIEYMATAK